MSDFVVLALEVKDTAVIKAASENDAIELYVLPEELADYDIAVVAMTQEEFDAMKESGFLNPNNDDDDDDGDTAGF